LSGFLNYLVGMKQCTHLRQRYLLYIQLQQPTAYLLKSSLPKKDTMSFFTTPSPVGTPTRRGRKPPGASDCCRMQHTTDITIPGFLQVRENLVSIWSSSMGRMRNTILSRTCLYGNKKTILILRLSD